MTSALALRRRGCEVTVLDRQRAARESSWAGGGILSPLYPWRYADSISALAAWGQSRYAHFCEELARVSGIDPQWRQSGLLCVGVEDADSACAWGRRFGHELQCLDDAQLSRQFPNLSVRACAPGEAHVWLPDLAQLRTPRYGKALRAALVEEGVELLEDCPVDRLWLGSEDSGAVRGVVCGTRRFGADAVVIAGGAWTGTLVPDGLLRDAIAPVKGQMLLFDAPGLGEIPVVLQDDRYLIQRVDGPLLIGSTLEDVGFDKSLSSQARESLLQAACGMLPALREEQLAVQWAGLRPGKWDDLPLIDAVPGYAGLFVNAGHFRNGVVLSLGSAEVLAARVLGEEPVLDVADFGFAP